VDTECVVVHNSGMAVLRAEPGQNTLIQLKHTPALLERGSFDNFLKVIKALPSPPFSIAQNIKNGQPNGLPAIKFG